MTWIISMMGGLAAGLFVYSILQIRLAKLEDEYRQIDASQSVLFKLIAPIMQVLAVYNQKIISEKSREKYKQRLVISGNPLHLIPAEFLALKEIGALVGLFFGFFLVLTIQANILFTFFLAVGGFFFPNFWLNEMISKRKHAIFISLPFSMDLLTLVVEAGLNFTAAIEEVVDKGQPGPLRDEFAKMLQDLRLGVSMRDALRGMAERTNMFEIRSFTSALIQADKLGTPLSEALRVQADIRRTERFQTAEKMAQESPVKMLFPLLFFIFPAVFIILLVPIILKFMAEGM
jgi:tight adherence protein C